MISLCKPTLTGFFLVLFSLSATISWSQEKGEFSMTPKKKEFPVDKVKEAIWPMLTSIRDNADDSAFASLTKQMYTLQLEYGNQKSELLNSLATIIKESEAEVYASKVGGVISIKRKKVDPNTYDEVGEMPHMGGCDDMPDEEQKACRTQKLLMNIYSDMKYPAEARKMGHEGMVVVRFIVDQMGAVTFPEIVRSVPGGCDDEVIRVVNNLKFVPGKMDGKPVKVVYHLPVKFKLE
ncbi:MAG: energy transducer TonB [Saprospiraceae bacterium]|nr:energy transducer TonB [Saprospiraceae bacterium]